MNTSNGSADTAFGGPIVEHVPGIGDVSFPRLQMPEYGTLEQLVRNRKAAKDRALLDECRITGADRFVALRDDNAKEVTFAKVDEYLRTKEGIERAIKMSLAKAGKTDAEATDVLGRLQPVEASDLARELAGFIRRQASPLEQMIDEARGLLPGGDAMSEDELRSAVLDLIREHDHAKGGSGDPLQGSGGPPPQAPADEAG